MAPGVEQMFDTFIVGAKGWNHDEHTSTSADDHPPLIIGQNCGAIFQGSWYIGIITNHSQERNDYYVRFMGKSTSSESSFVWPK